MKILSLFNKTILDDVLYKNDYNWEDWGELHIDLLICVGHEELFQEVMEDLRPKYYILETKKPYRQGTSINASLLSAQSRLRFYHTNIEFEQPKDLEIMLDIDSMEMEELTREDMIVMNKKKLGKDLWYQNKHTHRCRSKTREIGMELPYNVIMDGDKTYKLLNYEIAKLQGFTKYEKGIEESIHTGILTHIMESI